MFLVSFNSNFPSLEVVIGFYFASSLFFFLCSARIFVFHVDVVCEILPVFMSALMIRSECFCLDSFS